MVGSIVFLWLVGLVSFVSVTWVWEGEVRYVEETERSRQSSDRRWWDVETVVVRPGRRTAVRLTFLSPMWPIVLSWMGVKRIPKALRFVIEQFKFAFGKEE